MTVFLLVVVSIWLHELGHAAACVLTGDRLGSRRMTWRPLVNLDPILSLFLPLVASLASGGWLFAGIGRPFLLERADWRVLVAGPLVNLVLAALGYLGGNEDLLRVNVALFAINMMPLPPMDGWGMWKAWQNHRAQQLIARCMIEQVEIERRAMEALAEPPR